VSWPYGVSFAATIVIFALVNIVAIGDAVQLRARNREILDNMFASIELLARLGRHIDHQRLLIDAHILETDTSAHESVEARLEAAQREYDADALAYDLLATLPGEGAIWSAVKAECAELRTPALKVLALSRHNQDAEARRALAALDARFDEVERDVDRLRMINRLGAERLMGETYAAGRAWLLFLAVATFLGAAITTGVGWFSARLVSRREEELRQMAERLHEQNLDLDAFAGRVAHDLRGPLGTLSLAAAQLARNGSHATSGPVLQRAIKRMDVLIHDLLALARVGAAAEDAESDPSTVAPSIQEELAARAAESDAAITVEVAPAIVRCGEGLLRQLLWNLIDNGLKFGRAGVPVEVWIRGRVIDGAYHIEVVDNGVGMSPDEAHQAFDPFFRAQRANDTTGTGLGLSIVKRIVEGCGGRASIDSALGAGTSVLVELRLARSSLRESVRKKV
jgi:C4-dicarboxylate-specific signal transduction histidine kinase